MLNKTLTFFELSLLLSIYLRKFLMLVYLRDLQALIASSVQESVLKMVCAYVCLESSNKPISETKKKFDQLN